MLKIEIFPEHEQIETRIIPAKDGKPERTLYQQVAYAYLGGKFPVEMKLGLDKDETVYASGVYTVDPSSFIVNQYGSLELKRFGLKLERLGDEL